MTEPRPYTSCDGQHTPFQPNHPVVLFDLNNTLVSMPHLAYVRHVDPRLAERWEQGNPHAALHYEERLAQGLQDGAITVTVLPGVENKLTELGEAGLEIAVFSTCTGDGILAALRQTDLLIDRVYSTWDVQEGRGARKTPHGFARVDRWTGNRVIFYADDQREPLDAAKDYFGRTERGVTLYLVGNTNRSNSNGREGILSIPSISNITGLQRVLQRQEE
ncbi:hypothetical protein HYW21_05300 [Candidatus Woesearchaeota archaeon]|nr:hypothetical protein [Candidatus Woesearchaeota archaeon]